MCSPASSPSQSLGSEALNSTQWPFYDRPEPIRARSEGEKTWSASLDDIAAGETVCQRLVNGDGDFVFSVELLLSALEMSGIDNARLACLFYSLPLKSPYSRLLTLF